MPSAETTQPVETELEPSRDRSATPLSPGDSLQDFYRRLGVTLFHPVLKLPTMDQLEGLLRRDGGREELLANLRKRERLIREMNRDPFTHSYEPQMWQDADALLARKKDIAALGGNRAMKSHWAAKHCCKLLRNKPGAIVWCLSTSSRTSKRDQQPLIWHYLPLEWKKLEGTQTKTTYISYKRKTGFAEDSFVGPNGSQCFFLNYEQNRDVIEGGQVDFWWGDEMIPADWVETLRGRTIDRKGKGAVTFTPIRGFSATVSEYVTGATVTQWTDCELLPGVVCWPKGKPGRVPYIMDCLNPEHGVIFFQPKWNPFIDYQEELVKLWKPRGAAQILIRLHGVTQKTSGSAFPTFGTHNIIAHGKIPNTGTNYHLLDFAWNRNWFMLWLRVCEFKGKKRIYVYREWPDRPTYGEWCTMSEEADGARGPAQESRGYSIGRYREIILSTEGHELGGRTGNLTTDIHGYTRISEDEREPEIIHVRYGDARSGNAAALTVEHGGTTIREMLFEAGFDRHGLGSGPRIEVENVAAVDGRHLIEEGVNLINDWLEYDEDRPITVENEPVLYVSDQCENLRDAMKIWSGAGGEKGAAKDPIDLLRYAAVMDIRDVPPGWYGSRGGGSY